MDSRDKKNTAQKQIMNTLVKAAEMDETLELRKMVKEICKTYDVEERQARAWIFDLKMMGKVKTEDSLGCHWIWHSEEKNIRKMFLEQGKAFDIEAVKLISDVEKDSNILETKEEPEQGRDL